MKKGPLSTTKAAEYSRAWRLRHPEKRKADDKAYRVEHFSERKEALKTWRERNKEKAREYGRKSDLKRRQNKAEDRVRQAKYRYGLTDEQVERVRNQNLCECCGDEMAGPRAQHVDHNHTTGKFRGVLCRCCNLAAGYLKDSPTRARQLAEYLEKRDSTPQTLRRP